MFARAVACVLAVFMLGGSALAHAESAAAEPSADSAPWRATGAEDHGDPRVVTSLYVNAGTVAPGQTVRVGVLFEMDPEWHVYWRNPGQAALSTEVTFASPGAEFGELQWPTPEVFQQNDGFITTYGYGHHVVLFTDAVVSEDAAGTLSVTAVADYLTCKVECIPGRNEMTREVPVGAYAAPPEATAAIFAGLDATLPVAPSQVGWRVDARVDHDVVRPGDAFRVAFAASPAGRCDADGEAPCLPVVTDTNPMLTFVPERVPQVTFTPSAVRAHPSAQQGAVVVVDARANIDAVGEDQELRGVLFVTPVGAAEPWAFNVSVPLPRAPADAERAEVPHPYFVAYDTDVLAADDVVDSSTFGPGIPTVNTAPVAPAMPLWRLLVLALLGGMILNLMPCVLPVLGFKATSFVRLVHEDGRSVMGHALAYAAGIVSSMLILAGVVVALRAGGTAVGWGFQLQHPPFIAVLCVVIVFFAAALLGAWNIGFDATKLDDVRRDASGRWRSFLEGGLAVVLATPCSAPVLGSAVGFALTASAWVIFVTFAMIGVGLAAPFVLVVSIPGLERFIPRPGMWMVVVERLLGVTLLLAAGWLLWVCWRLTGTNGAAALALVMAGAGIAAWLTGRVQARGKNAVPVAVACIVAFGAAGATLVPAVAEAPTPSELTHHGGLQWQAWTPEAVEAAVAEGRTVFVDFTADWCITCKVNERTVLADERVAAAFTENDVTLFIGDWTRRDEAIRLELARYGKAGVPMYLVVRPGAPPEVLPELLTASRVIEAVAQR